MKHLFIVLFLIPTVYASPVQLFKRTYTNLRNLNLSECSQSYRFLNGNWMDCHFKLPDNKQVSPAIFPTLNHSFATELPGITAEIDIRTFTHTYEEASLETSMWVSVNYRKAGEIYIQTLPKEYYSPEIITKLIKKAFAISDKNGILTTTLLGVPEKNKWANEVALKSVYIGERTVKPELSECQKTYKVEMSDSWPEEDKPFSSCIVTEGVERQGLPLSENFWSKQLKSYKDSVSIGDIHFQFYNGQYTILVGENEDIPFAKAENAIRKAINELGTQKIVFMIYEDQINTLKSNERILGVMDYRNKIISSSEDIASEVSQKHLYP